MSEHWIIHGEPLPEVPPLHPRHGVHAPGAGTPARAPGSLRRTATTDMLRPRGVSGELVLRGRARDLFTPRTGEPRVIEDATLDARIGYIDERLVRRIATTPPIPGIEALVGVRASAGFRAAAELVASEHRERRSPLYLLLDDLPVTTLVSTYAMHYAGVRPLADGRHRQHPDLCAGWRTGGTILVGIEETGAPPVVTGPEARSLANPDDPLAWHALEPLGPNAMRRHRRLDLVAGETLALEVFFRDSHFSFAGRETVIHEYTIRGTLDPDSLEVIAIEAVPGALPYVECSDAASSAERLAGEAVAGLRRRVRERFVGPTTCTHLNDTLRSLEDVGALAPLLAGLNRAGATEPR